MIDKLWKPPHVVVGGCEWQSDTCAHFTQRLASCVGLRQDLVFKLLSQLAFPSTFVLQASETALSI